jgi:hypothetical protein
VVSPEIIMREIWGDFKGGLLAEKGNIVYNLVGENPMNKKPYLLIATILLMLLLQSCGDIDLSSDNTSGVIKIYSGSYGYDVAYRVDGDKVYSGSYGYDVAYRIDGNKIYSGAYGYNVAYRVDGNRIYSGSYGYDVAYRVDGDKVYSGGYGFNVAFRVGG